MSKANMFERLVKIYIVVREYDYEGSEIQGVFASRKKAEKFVNTFERTQVAKSIVVEWDVKY